VQKDLQLYFILVLNAIFLW